MRRWWTRIPRLLLLLLLLLLLIVHLKPGVHARSGLPHAHVLHPQVDLLLSHDTVLLLSHHLTLASVFSLLRRQSLGSCSVSCSHRRQVKARHLTSGVRDSRCGSPRWRLLTSGEHGGWPHQGTRALTAC